MDLRDFINVLQLSGTFFLLPTYFTLILVWVQMLRRVRGEYRWLLVGTLCFLVGHCLDMAYWSLPWGADFIHHPLRGVLFDYGLFFNVVFRQGAGFGAVYCHYRAALATADKVLRRLLIVSVGLSAISGLIVPLFLVWLRFN